MRKFIVSYKYIDKTLRERFGCIPILYQDKRNSDDNIMEVNDFIYDQVESHLQSTGLGVNNSNINVRTCWTIDKIMEL